MLKKSRIQILPYCWKCKEYNLPNFMDHDYLNCTEKENRTLLSFPQSNDFANSNLFHSLLEEETIFLNYSDNDSDSNKDEIDEEYSQWIIETVDSYLDPSEIENLTLTSDILVQNRNNTLEEVEMDNTINFVCLKQEIKPIVTCAICLVDNISISNTYYFNCNHGFCKDCVSSQIFTNKLTCALCRSEIKYMIANE